MNSRAVRATPTNLDPLSVQIMWNRLIHMTEECWVTVHQTAFSLIIAEALDFGCELLDARGNSLAHAARSMPVFNLSLPRACRAMLQRFPAETLEPGDVLITNDPWICAGHLPDIGVVTPVFHQGKLVGFFGTIANVADIGGTQDSNNARDLYEEGILIPPCKLYKGGRPNEDLHEFIAANVRLPHSVLGDIRAMVSANAVGAQKLTNFLAEYGLTSLEEIAAEIQGRTEQAMRAQILAIPNGVYRNDVWADGVDEPLRLPVEVTVSGDEVVIDFAGAPPQTARGGINCVYNYTAAHSIYLLQCLLTPGIPSNEGVFRPIAVRAPEGSILNARKPASVDLRQRIGWRLPALIAGALAPVIPDKVQAATGMPVGFAAYGVDAGGRPFRDHLFQGGGQGASKGRDGLSALLYPTSAGNVSVEMFETRVPLLVDCKELVPDSGGAGRWRGGLGQRVSVRRLPGHEGRVVLNIYPEGMLRPVPGLYGGKPGWLCRILVEEDSGRVSALAGGALVGIDRDDQRVTLQLPGGSGFGAPEHRGRVAAARDISEGFVTLEGIERDYGVRPDEPFGSPDDQ